MFLAQDSHSEHMAGLGPRPPDALSRALSRHPDLASLTPHLHLRSPASPPLVLSDLPQQLRTFLEVQGHTAYMNRDTSLCFLFTQLHTSLCPDHMDPLLTKFTPASGPLSPRLAPSGHLGLSSHGTSSERPDHPSLPLSTPTSSSRGHVVLFAHLPMPAEQTSFSESASCLWSAPPTRIWVPGGWGQCPPCWLRICSA